MSENYVFLTIWCVCGIAGAVTMWQAQRDIVSTSLCFFFGPIGVGVALVEYMRSRGF